jgi:3-methyladenine DNA glycosylase AlkD
MMSGAAGKQKVEEVLEWMESIRNDGNLAGMARYGIRTDRSFGISMEPLKAKAREIGKDQELALDLWQTGYRDARLLAVFISDRKQVTEAQMESWVRDFDSWDVCDGVCLHLFATLPLAVEKAKEWAGREEEFQRRAGFVLMATIGVKQMKLPDGELEAFLPLIEKYSADERNFVRKAVNWALRQIGKRSLRLNAMAIETAERIAGQDSKAARWIAKDALRELQSEAVQKRLRK